MITIQVTDNFDPHNFREMLEIYREVMGGGPPAAVQESAPRRGRPPGSTNAPKISPAVQAVLDAQAPPPTGIDEEDELDTGW